MLHSLMGKAQMISISWFLSREILYPLQIQIKCPCSGPVKASNRIPETGTSSCNRLRLLPTPRHFPQLQHLQGLEPRCSMSPYCLLVQGPSKTWSLTSLSTCFCMTGPSEMRSFKNQVRPVICFFWFSRRPGALKEAPLQMPA